MIIAVLRAGAPNTEGPDQPWALALIGVIAIGSVIAIIRSRRK